MPARPNASNFFLFVILPMVGLWLLFRFAFDVRNDILTLVLTVAAMATYFIWKAAARRSHGGDDVP